MDKLLDNKVAIITGAASGIGKSTVERFLSEGAQVLAVDREEFTQPETSYAQNNFKTAHGDVRERNDCSRWVETALSLFGRLDIVVNSAGISARAVGDGADFEKKWDEVLSVNLKGTMLMCHAAVPALLKSHGGAIVNLASIMSFVSYDPAMCLSDGFSPYPPSKGGVLQLTRDLALQVASKNIRVNAVRPGQIMTPGATRGTLNDPDGGHHVMEKMFAMAQIIPGVGFPEDVANLVLFLVSEDSRFITGEMVNVDGGVSPVV